MAEDEFDILAGEFALGVLEGEERAAAQRRFISDMAFCRAVDAWRARMQPLLGEVAEVDPPAKAWTAIETRLDRLAAAPKVLALQLRRWRAAAGVATAVAASLALALVVRPPVQLPAPDVRPKLVAQLRPSDAQAVLLASYEERSGTLHVTPAALHVGKRSAELWIIPEGQKPQSLGLVRSSGVTRLVLPARLRLDPGQGATIAVTLEPSGGSPTGQPTGPIVAAGEFQPI